MHKWETAGGQYGFHIVFGAVMCHEYSSGEVPVPFAVIEAQHIGYSRGSLVQLFVHRSLLI